MASAAHVFVKPEVGNTTKLPKLPMFQDGRDELDSYLQRFEWFATTNKWEAYQWAPALSTLLTGRTLEVYSRQSNEAVNNYAQLKEALLKRYDLTGDGYRLKFPGVDQNVRKAWNSLSFV